MIDENRIQLIKIEDIIPNRFQPRERFDEESLEDLAKSIKEHGVIQPILVRKLGDKYELIAGERRTKASSLAGLTTIPAIIRDMDDKESAKLSLLENLQRKNLTAIEEAKTYKRILQLDNITQDELAKTMGRSQPMVANKLRLLSLPEEVQDALVKNQISERHARSLLTIKDKKDQLMFLDRIKKERLTVRELDKEIKKYKEERENNNIEEDKERNMNNRSNFGGMGLNDYQTGLGNNMFNNIPNNFNNMASPVGKDSSTSYDYGDFNDNNSFNNQSIAVEGNNGMNIGNNNSLGSMFDGGMNQVNNNINNTTDNNDGNNLFISQIREDNVPKKENQFLPNFDDMDKNYQTNMLNDNFNNSGNMSTMNFNSPINNNVEPMNYNTSANYSLNNDPMNQNQFDQSMNMNLDMQNYQMPTNNYNDTNNMTSEQMNGFYPNQNYQQNMNQMNQPMPMGNVDMYGNNMNMGQGMPFQQTQSFTPQVNNDYAMNNFENYNPYNKQNDNRIPDFGNGGNYYSNSNGGNLFNQPLNIVGPYGPSQMNENQMTPAQPAPMTPPMYNQPINQPEAMQHIDTTVNSFEKPVEMPVENNNYTQPIETPTQQPIEEKNQYEQSIEMPTENDSFEKSDDMSMPNDQKEEISVEEPKMEDDNNLNEVSNSIPDIEVIGDSEIPIPTGEQKENNQDYIRLDEEVTIHNVLDAVHELKKTTDKIKQNHIDIDTEEVEFDDMYQITIKIKKEEN